MFAAPRTRSLDCQTRSSLTTALTTTHAHDRYWRQRSANRVNKQRARLRPGRELAVQYIDLVGKCILVNLRIAQHHRYFFRGGVPLLQEGNNRIGWIIGE